MFYLNKISSPLLLYIAVALFLNNQGICPSLWKSRKADLFMVAGIHQQGTMNVCHF